MKRKKTILFSIVTLLASSCGFAFERAEAKHFEESDLQPQFKQASELKPVAQRPFDSRRNTRDYFFYIKMGANQRTHQMGRAYPFLGLGYRFSEERSAIDVSADIAFSEKDVDALLSTSWLGYLSPQSESSLYYGAGLGFGSLRSQSMKRFTGLSGNACVGYEFNRTSTFRQIMEIKAYQPLVAIKHKGNEKWFSNILTPTVEASFGVGF